MALEDQGQWSGQLSQDVCDYVCRIPSLAPDTVRAEILEFVGSHATLLRPCTSDEHTCDCVLVDSFASLNHVLEPVGLELARNISGEVALLRFMKYNGNFRQATESSATRERFLLFWLLRHHRCIKILQLDESLMVLLPSIGAALGPESGLESIRITAWESSESNGAQLVAHFAALRSLKKLHLNSVFLNKAAAAAVAEALSQNPGMQKLVLDNPHLSNAGMRLVLRALRSCHQVESLSFSECLFSWKNQARLEQLLLGIDCNVRSLSLAYIQANLLTTVAHCLQVNGKLRELHLDNILSDSSWYIRDIAVTLRFNVHLETLSVQNCLFDVKAAEEVAQMLCSNTVLKNLALSICQMCDASAFLIAQALEVNRTLQTLDVHCNRLSEQSVVHMARSLARNDTLQMVDMGYIYFVKWDDPHLASVLRETGACSRMRVSWNGTGFRELERVLGDPNVRVSKVHLMWEDDTPHTDALPAIWDVLDVLCSNTTVTELVLDEQNMCLSDAVGASLARALQSTRTIKTVVIRSEMSEAMVASVLTALEGNESVCSLTLWNGLHSARTVTALARMLRANSTVCFLSFEECCFRGKAFLEFEKAMAANRVLVNFELHGGLHPSRKFARIGAYLQRNRAVLRKAVWYVTGTASDSAAREAFGTLFRKESLVQMLMAETKKTEDAVRKDILAVVERLRLH